MKVTFLGTGAVEGVPDPWCRCTTCNTARERGGPDVRFRSAVLVNDDLLIDAGPDVGAAAARLGLDLTLVQALLVTHPDSDHLDRTTLAARHRAWGGTPLPLLQVYASAASLALIDDPDALRLRPHAIAPFQRFEVGTGGILEQDPRRPRYPGVPPIAGSLRTVAARHGKPEHEAMLFVVRQLDGPEAVSRADAPTLFYGADTGPFPEQTWAALDGLAREGVRFGAVVLDATMGIGRPGHGSEGHLTLEQVDAHLEELARRGLLADGAVRLAHHFSHYFVPPHAELEELLAPEGLRPSHDGLVLNL
jgi:phosphoribosyl 1,2-cyclic phosphate phosphodiesterase